jgi:hypothetical protein
MGTRLELQAALEGLQEGLNVYFQPPPNVAMSYPAIVYNLDLIDLDFADNQPWYRSKRYQVMLIDPDPDSLIIDKLSGLPCNRYVRHFTTENLNHDIFDLYF